MGTRTNQLSLGDFAINLIRIVDVQSNLVLCTRGMRPHGGAWEREQSRGDFAINVIRIADVQRYLVLCTRCRRSHGNENHVGAILTIDKTTRNEFLHFTG